MENTWNKGEIMNSNKKESIAITALKNEVNKYDNLDEDLKKRDKEPIWDGNLYLYKKDSSKNTDMVGKIPVQVKGRDAKCNERGVFYDVKINDIENYRKTNIGAIFFVVEIDERRNTKIYYKLFDLKTIERILSENTTGNKTKRFKFKELKNNQLVSICIEFIRRLNIYKDIKPIQEIEVYDKKTICYDYNTKYELEEMRKSNEVFYETNAYKEAKDKLENQNIIILHGEPWVGKTSTARKLVMNYIEKGYMFIFGNVDDLAEIKEKIAIDEKIICLLDDFLGSNVQYLEKNVAESTLDRIVRNVKNSKDKKLILTTRTYIYNNAKKLFLKFHHATSIKDEYLIDVANYNYLEKGNILYNHMEKNNLIGTDKHIQLVDDEFYTRVISHENFNPGVIALICERLKDKENIDVKKYIRNALNSPEQLWDEEYQKLSIYEKMILIIIVLFGVKVPERCVNEQFSKIIENEKIQLLDKETFAKSIHVLSNAFIKVTFDDEQEKELEVCKHSVADYIIKKMKDGKIDIDRYIKSASYIEVLHYIDMVLEDNIEIQEKLANKIENDITNIKEFFYSGINLIYNILNRRLNPKRKEILKQIIQEEFLLSRPTLILEILEDEKNEMTDTYLYTKECFKNFIIESYDEDFIYGIDSVWDYEIFIKACLEILEYRKNSECMLIYLEDIIESLVEVVTQEVENTIEDLMMESVAKEIIEGKELEVIINEYIIATVNDEIPSLKDLYSREIYNKILNLLCKYCYVHVDRKYLEETIKEIKEDSENTIENKNKEKVYLNYAKVDKRQVEYIKEKFEKGIIKENKHNKIDNKGYYDILQEFDITERFNNWWIGSFLDENGLYEYRNIELYYEFINNKRDIDKSLKGLAKQFLDYLLHEKNNISKEAEMLLIKIAYNSFLKGNFIIDSKYLEQCEKEYPECIKELYDAEIIMTKNEAHMIINKYIHLYIAFSELIKKNDNLILIMHEWDNLSDENADYVCDREQQILQLYSEMDTSKFNQFYLIPALKIFVNELKSRYNKLGKINVTKAVMELIKLEIHLNRKFEIIESYGFEYLPMAFVEFVTNINLYHENMQCFDYAIYQKELYERCYDKNTDTYILDFNKMLKEKELKEICIKLKICDFVYDLYKSCEKTLNLLENNNDINVYNIDKEAFLKKYYK